MDADCELHDWYPMKLLTHSGGHPHPAWIDGNGSVQLFWMLFIIRSHSGRLVGCRGAVKFHVGHFIDMDLFLSYLLQLSYKSSYHLYQWPSLLTNTLEFVLLLAQIHGDMVVLVGMS